MILVRLNPRNKSREAGDPACVIRLPDLSGPRAVTLPRTVGGLLLGHRQRQHRLRLALRVEPGSRSGAADDASRCGGDLSQRVIRGRRTSHGWAIAPIRTDCLLAGGTSIPAPAQGGSCGSRSTKGHREQQAPLHPRSSGRATRLRLLASPLSPPYEQGNRGGPQLWPTATRAFPGCPKPKRNRSDIGGAFGELRDIRNDVTHHQPVWDRNPRKLNARTRAPRVDEPSDAARRYPLVTHCSRVDAIYAAGPGVFRGDVAAMMCVGIPAPDRRARNAPLAGASGRTKLVD